MTTNTKLLRAAVASVAGLLAATAVIAGGGPPGASASACERSVAIDPQVTVSEAMRTLTFVVYTGGCAVAGEVSFTVTDGTARRQMDFLLENGRLVWNAGDTSTRVITATVLGDATAEEALEYFRVTLVRPGNGVRIASGSGLGRIFDDDTRSPLATVDGRVCLTVGEGEKAQCALRSGGGMFAPLDAGVKTIEPGHIIQVPLVLNTANATDQSASFDTSDGTLLGGVDYEPVHQTIHIPAGAIAVFVQVKLLPHAFVTSGRHLNVHVSNYSAGGVISGSGQVTVLS